MNESNDLALSWVGSAMTSFSAFLQVNTLARYIVFGLGIASGLISIAYTFYKWKKRAQADKQVTAEEVAELIGEVNEQAKALAEKAEQTLPEETIAEVETHD